MAGPSPQHEMISQRFWVRLCCLLWRALGFFWVTVVFGLGINIASTRLTSPTGIPADTPMGWLLGHLVVTISLSAGLLLPTIVTGIVCHRASAHAIAHSISPTLAQEQRIALVRALREEYSKRLAQSLQGAAMMVLGLHERFDVTRSSAQLVFRRTDIAHRSPFPPGTSIVEVYDSVRQGFLILGVPGAGKTSLLLDLARELLTRAEGDPTYPIPVILNLSSWPNKKSSLAPWVVDQLRLIYGIPSQLSQTLMEQDQWLLLLDGLDEVDLSARSKCIAAINTYRENHFVPLVVCSRTQEYLTQEARLMLSSAVEVQPLQEREVTEYFKRLGKPMAAVRVALRTNPVLKQLLTTPLMLSVVILTYREKAIKELPRLGSAEEQQQQIFARYVERMLKQHITKRDFTPQQIYQWLIWLAQQMKERHLTEFYLEHLQPSWLPTYQSQVLYRMLGGLSVGLLTGLIGALFGGLAAGPFFGLLLGLVAGLFFGLLFGLNIFRREVLFREMLKWSWRKVWSASLLGLLGGLLGGQLGYRVAGLFFGLLLGLFGGLVVGLLAGPNRLDEDIRLQEVLKWSWRTVWHARPSELDLGELTGRLIFGLLPGLIVGVLIGRLAGLVIGVSVGLFVGLIVGLFGGPSSEQINVEMRVHPNQGIRSSGWTALRVGLIFGLLAVPAVGIIVGWLAGVFGGLLAGLLAALLFGGGNYLKHHLLRYILYLNGALSWRSVRFLEEATERILLHRVGGGYRFIHPIFLDYFASLGPSASLHSV